MKVMKDDDLWVALAFGVILNGVAGFGWLIYGIIWMVYQFVS